MNNAKPPMFGEYVKLNKTGEIVKWKTYDPKTETFQIELPAGLSVAVHRHDVARITADEELDFLRQRTKRSNQNLPPSALK